MNIENKLEDVCSTCAAFELDATCATIHADNKVVERTIVINCDNRETCRKIRSNLMKYDPVTGRRIL